MAHIKDRFPEVRFFFFTHTLRSNRGEYFDRPLFPGYLFFQIEKLTADFFSVLREQKDFLKILLENAAPVQLSGPALEELKLFIQNGEHWGVSKVKLLPDMKVRAISGPFVGHEGRVYRINRKKKTITILVSVTASIKRIDLLYEEAAVLEE